MMMKNNRFLACALAALLVLSAMLSIVPSSFAETEESEERELVRIEISTAQELLALCEECTLDAWSRDKEIVLTEDISLSGYDFEPIPSFGGVFNGQGHTISGLYISSSAAPSGLFGETQESAEIYDLNLNGTVKPSGDGSTVGGIVGKNRGLIQNCSFTGDVAGKSMSGGIVGLNCPSGTVLQCKMTGGVSGTSMTGGIVGKNEGSIEKCENLGYINIESADPNLNLDGLSLSSILSSFEDSSLALVNIATDTGGICGYSTGEILRCVNSGAVGYPHIGYNVGGIVGRNLGYVESCKNYGEIYGRKDIGGITGQMEPYVELVLTEDMAEKLQSQMGGLSYLLNKTVEDAHDTSDAAADHLSAIAEALRPIAESAMSGSDPTEIAEQMSTMMGSMSGVTDQLNAVASGMRSSGEELVKDMQSVINQLNAVNSTLSAAMNAVGGGSVTDTLSDTSQENVDQVRQGKVYDCDNRGSLYGDINLGGIAGSMSVEVEFDPEGDSSGSISSMLHREYEMKSIIQNCSNYGQVVSKKDCAGAICGNMELGLIFSCYGYGSVRSESGDYVGGIVGLTQGVVRASYAKCTLEGGKYVGGIAGSGTENSLTGVKSLVTECRSMVEITDCRQYSGAIAGVDGGDYLDNCFVSASLAGINRLNYSEMAEPVDYEEMLSLKGVPFMFRQLKLEFLIDGAAVKTQYFNYGASFDESVYPELPEREGCYGTWDITELNDLRFDTAVNAVYVQNTSALRSGQLRGEGRPIFFAEGAFRDGDEITVQALDSDAFTELPGGRRSVFEALRAGLRGDISRSDGVSELWSVSIPDDGQSVHVLRFLTRNETTEHTDIYLLGENGWEKLKCEAFGSYLTFTASGGEVTIAVVETGEAWWVIAVYAAIALIVIWLIIRLILLIAHASAARKAKKAAARGEEPQPVENDLYENTSLRSIVKKSRERTRPKRSRKQKLIIALASVGIVIIALGAFVFLRSDTKSGLELYRMTNALINQENANVEMSAAVGVGDSLFDTEISAFKTRVSGRNIYCVRQYGASIYYSDGSVYLENGSAFHLSDGVPSRWDVLKTILGLHRQLDIREHNENNRRIYSVDTHIEDTDNLIGLLFPTVAARLERVDSFHADVIVEKNAISQVLLQGSGKFADGAEVTLDAKITVEEPDALNNTVPAEVKAAMKEHKGENDRELTRDLVRMLYAWADLSTRDPMAADVAVKADCGAIVINDELSYMRTVVDGTEISCVQDGGISLYYADGKVCSQSGASVNLGSDSLSQSSRLLELAYQVCMNGSFSCVDNGESFTYTVSLGAEDIANVIHAIAPEADKLKVSPEFGSIEAVLVSDKIKSISIDCSGTLSVVFTDVDVSFGARIDINDAVTAFTVPDAVIEALVP